MRVVALRCITAWSLWALSFGLMGCSFCVQVQDCCPPACGGTHRIGFDVPAAVHAGVLKALPGFVATEMEIESKDGRRVYEFEGRSGDAAYEIEVDEQGNVLEVETKPDHQDNDGDDENRDEDED